MTDLNERIARAKGWTRCRKGLWWETWNSSKVHTEPPDYEHDPALMVEAMVEMKDAGKRMKVADAILSWLCGLDDTPQQAVARAYAEFLKRKDDRDD